MALKITFIVLAILALAIIAFCFIFCEIERKKLFPRRCDRNEYTLQDRPLTDFKNMQYKDFCFYSKKSILRGRFYFKDNLENNNLIVFCHGYGAGHEAYLTEIDYYINKGFTCIGFDYSGCKLSDGLTSHFGASVQNLNSLYNYLEEIDFIKDKNLYLWGHSWGAYTALIGSKLAKVKKVVAFCPFNKPQNLIEKQSGKFIKGFSKFLIPFRWIFYKVKYGKNTNEASYKTINKTLKPALIIFGEKDQVIGKINYNFNKNVTTILCKDKAHNPYNSVQAEEYLNQTISEFYTCKDKLEFLSKVDYKKITEQDLDILQKTIDFLS